MKSRYDEEVDEVAVKQFNEEQKDWTAICRICGQHISGTLTELRQHRCIHGK